MQKIKNKFIIFIILVIVGIIGFGGYSSYYQKKIDRKSHIVLIKGNATLNSKPIKIDTKEIISIGDNIRTIGNSSLAVLEWGDGSVTRLGGNSALKIDNLYVSENLKNINISFELLNGKTWSTVISFLGKDSYFNETFDNSVAAVRGTIFNVDLDKKYLYVIDHKVNLTKKDGEIIIVNEKSPFSLDNFNFISLEEFLESFKDKTWAKLNYTIDKDLFKGLEKQVYKDLDKLIDLSDINIDKLLDNEIKKEKLYNQIISDYQKLNFIRSDNDELFKKKIELKEALIKLSTGENKKILIQNTFYDFHDIIDSKNYKKIDILLPILKENKEILSDLNFSSINFNTLPEVIKSKFIDLEILFLNKKNEFQNIDYKNKLNNIDTKIKEDLDVIKNSLINN